MRRFVLGFFILTLIVTAGLWVTSGDALACSPCTGGTIKFVKEVNNRFQGTAVPNDFDIFMNGGNVEWGTAYRVSGTVSFWESSLPNYQSGNFSCKNLNTGATVDAGSIPGYGTLSVFYGQNIECRIVNSDVQTHGSFTVYKFDDPDGDGVPSVPYTPLSGWTFDAYRSPGCVGSAFMSGQTDSFGKYTFSDLEPGTYWAKERRPLPTGWEATTTPECVSVVVTAKMGETLWFGNRLQRATVKAFKFIDLNDNATRDLGEPMGSGWTFILSDGTTTMTKTTEIDGFVVFPDLTPNVTYELCEVQQLGWHLTTPWESCVDVIPGPGSVVKRTFGNAQDPGSLQCVKWNDTNGNGLEDANGVSEVRMSGWTCEVYSEDDKLLGSCVTGDDGTCMLGEDFYPGIYKGCEIPQKNWSPTTDICQLVEVVPGQMGVFKFGNTSTPTALDEDEYPGMYTIMVPGVFSQ